MNTYFEPKHYCALAVLPALVFSFSAQATPWLDTGDMKLRHELQILSDAGMLDAPLTTWPLATKDIHRSLEETSSKEKENSHPELMGILANINHRLEEEDYGSGFKLEANARSKKLLIRDFSGEGREKSSVSYDGDWGNSLIDARLKVAVAEKSSHPSDKKIRLDESYVASSLGNWKFTVGKQSRWWGPSWDGSLILSNNARPIPSVSLENISSKAFDNKWLHWLGPNKLHMFVGQLESDRGVPNAKLIGTRFTFKPFKPLEIGLSRVIQLENLNRLGEALLGNYDEGRSVTGNSAASIDFRWRLPVGAATKNNIVLYGELFGEDRKYYVYPTAQSHMLGFEASGLTAKFNGTWRTYIEYANTFSDHHVKGGGQANITYDNPAFPDGYRHLNTSMGHSIDADSNSLSAGIMLSQNNGDFWRGWIKKTNLNTDGTGGSGVAPNGRKWSAIGISLDKKLNKQSKLNLGLQFTSDKETGKSADNDFGVSIGYSRNF